MAERTAPEAIEAYLAPRRRMVSVVTPVVLRQARRSQLPDDLVDVILGNGEPVRLRGRERINLGVRMRVRLNQLGPPRGPWEAETAAYEYRMSDEDDREILVYHWHPDGQSHVTTPHLHLGPGTEVGRAALLTAHLPTGLVPIHAVLRLAIESLGTEPARRDWDPVLHAT